MRLKLDNQGHAVLNNGHPVYICDDGRELAFDATAAFARAEQAETKLAVREAFEHSHLVIDGRLALPAEMVRAAFEGSFTRQDGKIVGIDPAGQKVFSRKRPGEIADFDEALELLIARHPNSDAILKSRLDERTEDFKPAAGNGFKHGRPTLRRGEFDRMPPDKRMAYIKAGGILTD